MPTIERFEDIEAWQEARRLAQVIYAISRTPPLRADPGLADQLRRASVSVMANIAEGFQAGSSREFAHFLHYAVRSATEVQSHLYVAKDQGYLDEGSFVTTYELAGLVRRLIGGFIRYLRTANREPPTVNRQP